MTITVTNIEAGPVAATGSAQTLPFGFKAFTEEEVEVYALIDGVELISDPDDYSVTLNENADGSPAEGGSIAITAPAGRALYVRAKPRLAQGQVWSNQGSRLVNLNEALDRAALVALRARYDFARAIAVAGSGAGFIDKVDKTALQGAAGAALVGVQKPGGLLRDLHDVFAESTSSGDFETLSDAAASFGTDTPPFIEGMVYIPNGVHPEGFVAGQATRFVGQSRGGAILQPTSGGSAALIDARRTRGSGAENTWGAMSVEHLTIDGSGFARPGVCLYGGGCSIREVTIDGCESAGLQLQYVLKTTVDTVTVQNCTGSGLLIDTDAIHAGDVNTSIKISNFWSLDNGGWGAEIEDVHYSTFTMTTQGNAAGGIRANGSGSSVAACLSFIGCASEVDGGSAFHGTALRDFLIADFFLLANPAYNSFVFDGCTGTVIGLTDTTVHTGGTYTVSILNPAGLGLITFIGGNITMDPTQMKYCVFVNCIVNGNLVSSVNSLALRNATDSQSMSLAITAYGGDFGGLSFLEASGARVGFVSSAGAAVWSGLRGAALDTSGMVAGDYYFYPTNSSLEVIAKCPDGTIRTGPVATLT